MAAPRSATTLPMELSNNSQPLVTVRDAEGRELKGYISKAWRYVFSALAVKTTAIDPEWTQSVSNPPTQAEVQAIVTQVELLSQALGKT